MKFSQLAVSALIAASSAKASEADPSFDDIVAPPKSDDKKSKVDHPDFEPLTPPKGTLFFEQFVDKSSGRWKASNAVKAGTDGEFSYVGKWKVEEPSVYPGFKGDKGLVAKSPAAHHAISALFDKPIDNTDKTLVVQYEVKLQKSLECGGAYIKLLSENQELHDNEFSNESPYQIMFGPDKCGSTNKVHFIIRRKNPKTGEYEEKHLTSPPPARLNTLSNLYTLIIHPNQDFEIRINGKVSRAGNLLEEGVLFPSLSPSTEVDDSEDVKPKDWVDDVYIPDPEQATKPEDWDEDAPAKIPDPKAVKPKDWEEDTPLYIPDPEAEIPEDWDEEEDGEYVAPEIENPECALHGCGPWKAPVIVNPEYKGKWVQPEIPNPDYKGEWAPRKIPNPDYYEDTTPSNIEPIGGVGIEIWTMQNNILFDNFYISHSVEDAEYVGNKTFVPKLEIENEEEKAAVEKIKPKDQKQRKTYPTRADHFRDDPVDFVVETAKQFILNVSADPVEAIKADPFVFLAFVASGFAAFSVFFGVLGAFAFIIKSIFVGGAKADKKKPAAATTKKAPKIEEIVEKEVEKETAAVASSKSTETEAVKRPAAKTE